MIDNRVTGLKSPPVMGPPRVVETLPSNQPGETPTPAATETSQAPDQTSNISVGSYPEAETDPNTQNFTLADSRVEPATTNSILAPEVNSPDPIVSLEARVADTLNLGGPEAHSVGQLNQALQSLRQLTNSGSNASLVSVLQRFQSTTLPENLRNLAATRQELRDLMDTLPDTDPDREIFEQQLQIIEGTQELYQQAETLLNNSPLLQPVAQSAQTPIAADNVLPPPPDLERNPELQTVFQAASEQAQSEFAQRFAGLAPAEQTAALEIGSRLLQNPPPEGLLNSLRANLAELSTDQRMAVGRTLNSLNVFIPNLTETAPGAEDFSARLREIEMGYAPDVQASYIADFLKAAGPEDLRLTLQIDAADPNAIAEARADLMTRSGLNSEEFDERVRFVPTGAAIDGWEWGEDNKALAQDGAIIVPPNADEATRLAAAFVRVETGANLTDASAQGAHTASAPRFDVDSVVNRTSFQSNVTTQNLQESALALAAATGRPVRQARTYSEGGNMLVGTQPSGDAYAVIGRDSLLTSTFLLEQQFRDNPASVPEFAPERIASQRTEMGLDQTFENLPVDQQSLIDDTAIRLNGGPVPAENLAAQRERASEFLIHQELTKPVFAQDLGIEAQNLVFISQPDFHIDMHLRPARPGEVLVNDFAANESLIQSALTRATPGSWEETELRTMLERNQATATVMAPVMAQISQQLEAAGLTAIPAPGVMDTVPSSVLFDIPYGEDSSRQDVRNVNFMNAIPASRAGSNEQIFFTNATSIAPLQDAYNEYLRETMGVSQTYFMGGSEGGASSPNIAEISLIYMGGLDCRETHSSNSRYK